jgi:teichuronic acid biosynthesis glycosyltransferase TuaH
VKILYISLLDWFITKQRPQHLAEQLSKFHEVHYFNVLPFNNSEMNRHNDNDVITKTHIKLNERLTITRKRVLPKNSLRFIRIVNDFLLKKYLKLVLKVHDFDVIWLSHPSQFRLIPKEYLGKIIYDCMDKYDEFSKDKTQLKQFYKIESELIARSDLMLASSKGLLEDLQTKGASNAHLINNAALFDLFNVDRAVTACPPEIDQNTKNIGYFGGIGAWFDTDLLVSLATRLPNVNFVIIGPISEKSVVEKTRSFSNIHLLGTRIFSDIPSYLSQFDVCLLPFQVNELIRYVDPVKVYEYLSAGKPAVVPKYDEILKFSKYVYISDSAESFYQNVLKALSENNEALKDQRIKFASENTWPIRAAKVNELLKLLTDE